MDNGDWDAIEWAIDGAASAGFAGAGAFAAWAVSEGGQGVAAAVAAFAFAGALAVLRRVESNRGSSALPSFEVSHLEEPRTALLLEDRLTSVASDSRVAQLFIPASATQLARREDAMDVDASDALHAVLAEIRRSLR